MVKFLVLQKMDVETFEFLGTSNNSNLFFLLLYFSEMILFHGIPKIFISWILDRDSQEGSCTTTFAVTSNVPYGAKFMLQWTCVTIENVLYRVIVYKKLSHLVCWDREVGKFYLTNICYWFVLSDSPLCKTPDGNGTKTI